MIPPEHPDTSPVIWGDDGQPRSRLFADVYFSTEDGLAETRAVFLAGCGLPDAWSGRHHFTVAELGFGTGLNIAALLTLWRQTAAPAARLHIFSIEAHPLSQVEARRALAAWPDIAEAADALTTAWPSPARGFHRLDLPAFRATLDLAICDVLPALKAWSGRADAWFLDGFSPAANPGMWSDAVLALVAARSAPGARAATFTVAGQVRRGLQMAGFTVDKRPGHGRKRERLEAVLPGEPNAAPARPTVAVIGGGIAGAAMMRALHRQGIEANAVAGPDTGASGNSAALVTPALDASAGPMARFYAQAHARAVHLFEGEAADSIIARGVVRLPAGERDPGRFAKVAAQDLFAPGDVALCPADITSERTGEPSPAGLMFRQSLVIEPAAVIDAWLGEGVVTGEVERLQRDGEAWRLVFTDGRPPLLADRVIIAGGWASRLLIPELALLAVRGQASFLQTDLRPAAQVYGDYLIPTRDGLLFGATHDRDETSVAAADADNDRNRAKLAASRPAMAERLAGQVLIGRAAIRAATPDRLPIAGALADPGLFVLSGLGSRGFTTAPLLAEHVAALILGLASPLPADLAARVAPLRFAERRVRDPG